MEKTQRTAVRRLVTFCKKSAILLFVIIGSTQLTYSQCPMVCHNVNLSLDTITGGKTTILPENILTNPASCPGGVFVVELFDPYGNSIANMVDCQWAGYTLIVKVTDQISRNNCWAKVKVEDKAGPNLNCVKDTISCLELNEYSKGLDRFPLGRATDNCGASAPVSIAVVCTEFPCSNTLFVAICQRTVIATDKWGLTSTCRDSLWISRDTLSNLIAARDTMVDCSVADSLGKDQFGNPLPQKVGVPTIKGNPVWPNFSTCKIISRYTDKVFPICGRSRKIRREWTVTDWCTRQDTVVLQWIKIIDTTDPTLTVPLALITKSAGAHDCNAPVDLPRPKVSDCSGIKAINYFATIIHAGKNAAIPTVISGSFKGATTRVYLPSGTHQITYYILDSCDNTLEAIQVVTINDQVPPTPVCDERTATTLDPQSCWSRIYAADLDNGSHDNCCNTLYFSVASMDTIVKYQELLIAKIKSKYGLDVYISRRAFFDLLIDKYINCAIFNDYIDLGQCGNKQLVMRVYEACNLPQYDPHVHGDSRHDFYCKAAYGNAEFPYGNGDSPYVDRDELYLYDFIVVKRLLGTTPVNPADLNFILAPKNYNDCMVWVNVADKQAPTCTVASEKYAYCDGVPYENQLEFNYFDELEISPICNGANGIYDPAYLLLDSFDVGSKVNPKLLFDSAFFKDNCGSVLVTSKIEGAVNNCGAGILTKTWTGKDQCGQLSTTCAQKLKMFHRSDFEVVFPKDIETTCLSNLGQLNNPTGENYPKIFDNDCEQIGVSFEDTRYEIAANACFKILRTWKLIDWCAYNPELHDRNRDFIADTTAEFRATLNANDSRYCTYRWLKDNGDGYIYYTQVIKVINTVLPIITKSDSIVACADNGITCQGRIRLKMNGSDDCTPIGDLRWIIQIDSFNDGSINKIVDVTGSMATIDGDFPVGIHKITFVLRDLCGNESARTSIVDVRLCKKPTPYVLNGIAANLMPIDNNRNGIPESGMLTIWASDFNAGSTAGCGQKIQVYSFSSDTTKKSITYTCDSVGLRLVNIWVTDTYGNKDFAQTYILVQDNNKACTGGIQPIAANINGVIKTEDKLEIEKVNVSLSGSSAIPSVTKADGIYAFNNMRVGGSYTVMPKKNINAMNGVSSLDLLMIQKHILGVQTITSPYKLIAADINKSNDVSSVDLVELRKLILGVYENFQGNESWRFIPADYKFKNALNPFDGGFPEHHVIPAFNSSSLINFVGVKVGDVNGTVTPNQLMGSELRAPGKELVFSTKEQIFKSGELVTVPVNLSASSDLLGYQFTAAFDPSALELINIAPGIMDMTAANFGTNKKSEGVITTSFTSTKAFNSTDKALFSLQFKATKGGKLSELIQFNSKVTKAEAYNTALEVINVKLAFTASSFAGQTALLQNTPNPFRDQTRIGFVMNQTGQAQITLFDLNGRIIKQIVTKYNKGYNEVQIQKQDVHTGGVFYYQLQADGYTATRKMIVLE